MTKFDHAQKEIASSEEQGRSMANLYREVPLTGSQLSEFPPYRLPSLRPVGADQKISDQCHETDNLEL